METRALTDPPCAPRPWEDLFFRVLEEMGSMAEACRTVTSSSTSVYIRWQVRRSANTASKFHGLLARKSTTSLTSLTANPLHKFTEVDTGAVMVDTQAALPRVAAGFLGENCGKEHPLSRKPAPHRRLIAPHLLGFTANGLPSAGFYSWKLLVLATATSGTGRRRRTTGAGRAVLYNRAAEGLRGKGNLYLPVCSHLPPIPAVAAVVSPGS